MRLAREVTSAGAVRCTEKARYQEAVTPGPKAIARPVALATGLRAQPQICGNRARSDRLRRCLSTPHGDEIRYRVLLEVIRRFEAELDAATKLSEIRIIGGQLRRARET